MKYLLAIVWLGLSLGYYTTNAQANTDNQFAYNYGILIGYDFQEMNIHHRRIPVRSMLAGMEMIRTNSQKVTEADALKAIETTKTELQARKTTTDKRVEDLDYSGLGYNYGVVIGSNWKTLDVAIEEETIAAFQEGMKAVYYDAGSVASREEAQAIVTQKYLELHKDRAALQAEENKAFFQENSTNDRVITLESGTQYEVLRDVEGAPIGDTDAKLKIYYVGRLTDGTLFSSVTPPSQPIVVTLDGVMEGWKQVLPLMRENQTIKAYIPPQYGYGEQKRENVPPNSILVYEITLMEVMD